jgi:hypothetical protein
LFGLFKMIISIFLIVGIVNPRFAWEMSEGWKFKDAEPSEAYLVMTRISSVIILIVLWVFIRM